MNQNTARPPFVTQLATDRYLDPKSARSALVLPVSQRELELSYPAHGKGETRASCGETWGGGGSDRSVTLRTCSATSFRLLAVALLLALAFLFSPPPHTHTLSRADVFYIDRGPGKTISGPCIAALLLFLFLVVCVMCKREHA